MSLVLRWHLPKAAFAVSKANARRIARRGLSAYRLQSVGRGFFRCFVLFGWQVAAWAPLRGCVRLINKLKPRLLMLSKRIAELLVF